jgi:hypothetical protein
MIGPVSLDGIWWSPVGCVESMRFAGLNHNPVSNSVAPEKYGCICVTRLARAEAAGDSSIVMVN